MSRNTTYIVMLSEACECSVTARQLLDDGPVMIRRRFDEWGLWDLCVTVSIISKTAIPISSKESAVAIARCIAVNANGCCMAHRLLECNQKGNQ